MQSGYVLSFTNRTFEEFVFDSTRRRIYDGAYSGFGSSKANHLRCFWEQEADHVVGKLLKDLVECSQLESPLRAKCREIADRLL
jgi:hypothetical protein